jgi:hypothetical protein
MANIFTLKSGLASDPTVWSGGVVPTGVDRVLIMASHVVELNGAYEWGDDSTATITINGVSTNKSISVGGTLKHSRTVSSSLTCVGQFYVLGGGYHDMGTEADPILLPVTVTMSLNKSATMAINKYGYETTALGRTTAWGSSKLRTANLTATAIATATSIQVVIATGWKAGDEIVISQTDMTSSNRYGFGVIAAGYVSGSLTIPLVSPLSFTHTAGALVGNVTNNVTVKSLNYSFPAMWFHLYSGQSDLANSREFGHITLDDIGGFYPAYGLAIRYQTNYSANPYPQIYRAMKGITVHRRSILGATQSMQLGESSSAATPTLFDDLLVVSSDTQDGNGPYVTPSSHVLLTRPVFLNISYNLEGGTDVAMVDGTLIGRRRDGFIANGSISGDIIRLKRGGYFFTGASGVLCNAAAQGRANDTLFDDCDFGVTYPLVANAALFYLQTLDSRLTLTVQDSVFSASVIDPTLTTMGNLTDESFVRIVNRNKDANQQIEYKRQGIYRRDNVENFRSSSSLSMRPNFVGRSCSRVKRTLCANGTTIQVIGYIKMDTAYYNGGDCNLPTVTMSGNGITPVIFTMTGVANTWQKFDFTVTNASGFDGSFSITTKTTPKTVATGTIYIDGVPDAPFVTKTRHYGFIFDEANPIRVVNPFITSTEAEAAALTGVLFTPTKITLTAGTANTWSKIYDAYNYWACLNLAEQVRLTSSDGNIFTLPTTVEVEMQAVPTSGVLGGGLIKLSVPGIYSYNTSGTYLEFTTAGTYDLSTTTFDGTTRLINSSGGNVTLKVPADTTTNNIGPNIILELPSTDVIISVPAMVAGTRVQLLNITDGIQVYNDILVTAGLTISLPYTGDKVIRLRADDETKLPLQTAGVLSSSGLSFLDVQLDDTVYSSNAIDGSLVTEFSADGPNIQIDINDPDGITNIQRLYAWIQWYMTTEAGIASDFFGAVYAIDTANYIIDQTKADIKLDNISAIPLRVVGGYLARRDGSTVIAPLSGSIQIDPGKAYAIETGVSGLTVDESNKLNYISLLSTEATTSAALVAADLAASRASDLLARPVPPTASTIGSAVWADPAASSVATETTAALAASRAASILALPAPPTASAISTDVWANATVATLATEATSQQLETTSQNILTQATTASQEATIAKKLAANKAVVSDDGLLVTIYDDDGVTVLQQFSLSENKLTRTPL